MNELITYLAVHGVAIALGVLAGAAVSIAFLAGPLSRVQEKEDDAYFDGYGAGVRDTKAEVNVFAFDRLGKRANL